ncbi:MAG: response regulator, partial [Rhodospirillales bacterium]
MTVPVPLRILVVDDEPAIRRLLHTTLVAQGYQTFEAADGRAALEAVGRHPVDLMILDLGLPDVDGTDIIAQLRGAGSAL